MKLLPLIGALLISVVPVQAYQTPEELVKPSVLANNMAPIKISPGMAYAQARTILMSNGWQPLQKRWQDRSCPEYMERCKFPETEACAPTGTAPCISYFQDIYRNVLKVHSNGGRTSSISNFYLDQ